MIHILLPAYNEAEALSPVINGISRALADGGFRIWVVDDGSSDRTSVVALERRSEGVPLTLVRHETNRGLGEAFHSGISALLPSLSSDDVLVALDADDTHPPALIPSMARLIETGEADVVIASRFAAGGREIGVPLLRRVLSLAARGIFSVCLPVPGVKDYTCAFRAFRGDLIRRGQARWGRLVTEKGFSASIEWLLRLAVFSPRIKEIPLVLRYDRKPTPSKMRIFQTIVRTFSVLARLRKIRG